MADASFRSDIVTIRVIDPTLRDGRYVNDHGFTPQQAAALVAGIAASGLDYVEIGYYRPMTRPCMIEGQWRAAQPGMSIRCAGRRVSDRNGLTVVVHVHQVMLDDYAHLSGHAAGAHAGNAGPA